MRCSFHPDYDLPLPATHPFPMAKYPLLRAILVEEGLLAANDVLDARSRVAP